MKSKKKTNETREKKMRKSFKYLPVGLVKEREREKKILLENMMKRKDWRLTRWGAQVNRTQPNGVHLARHEESARL